MFKAIHSKTFWITVVILGLMPTYDIVMQMQILKQLKQANVEISLVQEIYAFSMMQTSYIPVVALIGYGFRLLTWQLKKGALKIQIALVSFSCLAFFFVFETLFVIAQFLQDTFLVNAQSLYQCSNAITLYLILTMPLGLGLLSLGMLVRLDAYQRPTKYAFYLEILLPLSLVCLSCINYQLWLILPTMYSMHCA